MTCLDDIQADILQPVRERYEFARKELFVFEKGSIYYKAKEGMLSGLDGNGCLQSAKEKGMICWECFGSLKYDKVPPKALVNGTWPGLVPPELKDLTQIEVSMISIYNNITILQMLPSGMQHCDFCIMITLSELLFLFLLRFSQVETTQQNSHLSPW